MGDGAGAAEAAELESEDLFAAAAALEWLRTQVDPELIDGILEAVAEAEAHFGYR